MNALLMLAILAASPPGTGLTASGHPGPLHFTAADFDQRYAVILTNARLAKSENPDKMASIGVADWRMKEYPSGWSLSARRRMYARELKAIEQERQAKSRAESRRVVEELNAKGK